ncbi:hypothetical protein SYNPS1DRAFT_27906 [Syncephalis pseudoplumigaleata]|uniref:ERCC4 domain-containing protein n=1 Tax=Syncephalis pseudoplumigaleata TaxID=1712513 RepID=A0A4P9Z233_9FUNG|nr:hypothetical protein SYNPS1DRAFT_27906 [Syncephalis pseudoplumigaleata]|eukprot:RKP26398.1 hypothetical protein SYNPS1DRAFT_27906 [Syncephalis pseudoplumigaleata]
MDPPSDILSDAQTPIRLGCEDRRLMVDEVDVHCLSTPLPTASVEQDTGKRAMVDAAAKTQKKAKKQAEAKRAERAATLEIRQLNTKSDKQAGIRQMVIVLHNFSQLKGGQQAVDDALRDMSCATRSVSDPLLLDGMAHVTWRQRRMARYDEDRRLFLPTSPNTASTEEEKPLVAAVLPIVQLVAKTNTAGDERALMETFRRSYPGHRPMLVVHGLAAYLRKRDATRHRWYAERVRNQGRPTRDEPTQAELGPDRAEIERRLIVLQLQHRCLIIMVEQWSELAKWIYQCCGELSVHWQKSVQATVHGGLPRVPTGKTATETWRIMLEQVYACGAMAAAAIVQRYPSPYALHSAYSACTSTQRAEQMLASLAISYGPIGAQHTRRLGPTLSRRIYRLFNATDPDEIQIPMNTMDTVTTTYRLGYYLAPISAVYTPVFAAYSTVLGARSCRLGNTLGLWSSQATYAEQEAKAKNTNPDAYDALQRGTSASLLIIALAELNGASSRALHTLLATLFASHVAHSELTIHCRQTNALTRALDCALNQGISVAAAGLAAYLTYKRVF